MRSALILAAALVAACKGEPFRPDAADQPIDAAPPPWFQPKPREAKNWDIQLSGYNFATPRTMMIVNLWDVVPSAQTITYPKGPVTVPAGSQPTAIATLKGMGTKVICHVGMGVVSLADPDAMQLEGYAATPPDRPDAIAAGSVIGWTVPGTTDRFVNYRDAGAQAVLLKRIELAKAIGCDGVAAFRTDLGAFLSDTGFTAATAADDVAWIEKLATDAHAKELSIGGRGVLPNNIGAVKTRYDWLVAERCAENDDCDSFREITSIERSVFGLDYTTNIDGVPTEKSVLCPRFADDRIDGLLKDDKLDGSAPATCD